MRIYPGTTVDYEFAELGTLGFTGTLNDRQFAALRNEGYTGALPDMFAQFDGTLGGGAPDYAAEVEAFLSGTAGFAMDFTDTAVMWEESTKVTPVGDVADPIGAVDTKYGTTTYTLSEASGTLCGAWTGTSWEGDGAGDRLLSASNAILNDKPAATMIARVRFDTITAGPAILSLSTNTGTASRFVCDVLSTGAIRLRLRRLDADTENSPSSATGVIVAGNTYTIRAEVDYAGAGTAKLWVDGSLVIDTTITGAPANTSATDSNRFRFSIALSNTLSQWLDGGVSRLILAPKLLTAGETTSGIGYVEDAVA